MVADEVTKRVLATYEGGNMITMCAWCRQVEFDGDVSGATGGISRSSSSTRCRMERRRCVASDRFPQLADPAHAG